MQVNDWSSHQDDCNGTSKYMDATAAYILNKFIRPKRNEITSKKTAKSVMMEWDTLILGMIEIYSANETVQSKGSACWPRLFSPQTNLCSKCNGSLSKPTLKNRCKSGKQSLIIRLVLFILPKLIPIKGVQEITSFLGTPCSLYLFSACITWLNVM